LNTTLLARAGQTWFLAAAIGQGLFLAYILGFYGPTLPTGDFAQWARNERLITGFVAGDVSGNLQFAIHVGAAAILTLGGLLQLIPALRRKAPALHRWTGRIFIVTALVAALGGLWLVWVRGSQTSLANSIGTSLNAGLIVIFAALAWRAAMKRDFAAHQHWAMRTFLVVSGVWFLRVGVMAYGAVAGGVFGADEAHLMTFFDIWNFGSYLVPLAVYELYRRAKAGRSATFATVMMICATIATAAGSILAFLVLWRPPMFS
jgi:hypothetical protein